MPRLGPWELGLILLIVLIIFGAGRLPQLGSAFGKTIREFRRMSHDEEEPANKSKGADKS